jgi:ribosomal-protein-alanine N-acetyltransferase
MGRRVYIRPGSLADEPAFLAAVGRSRRLHHPWVQPPGTPDAFREYLARRQEPRGSAFFIWLEEPGGLVGVVNLDEIVHGSFRSAYLGYYAFVPHAGHGLMKDGLAQVITHAFKVVKLHRLEANIQPGNRPSKALSEDQRPLARPRALGNTLRGLVRCATCRVPRSVRCCPAMRLPSPG